MATPPVPHKDFYVYALFRADGGTPFYIGKGRGNRINIHERDAMRNTSHKDRIIQSMHAAGIKEIPKAILISGLTDEEAKQSEIDLIQLIGRWPTGPLSNLTSGGDGVASLAPESRARKSAANVASWADPSVREKRTKGIARVWTAERRAKHSVEVIAAMTPARRERMRVARKAAQQRPEVQAAVIRAARDPRSRAAKSEAMKEIWKDPQKRERRSAANAKFQSRPEYKEKRSKIAKRIWQTPTSRAKMLTARAAYRKANPITEEQRDIFTRRLNAPAASAKRHATNLLPEVRARRIAAQKAAFSTPEAKAKRSEASKKMWAAKKGQYVLPFPSDKLPPQPPPKHP